jgi:hypothetical protein
METIPDFARITVGLSTYSAHGAAWRGGESGSHHLTGTAHSLCAFGERTVSRRALCADARTEGPLFDRELGPTAMKLF